MHYRERRHRSVKILGKTRDVTAWRQRDWNFECPERGAKRRGVVFGAVASIPPNLKSKSGASPPHFWAHVSPTFGLNTVPLPLRAPFLSCLPSMALSDPFPSPFSLLCFPMLYLPFLLRSLLPFSFLPLPFPEGPHTQLEGLASQVL